MRVVAIEEHHIIPEMRSRMDLSLLPPAYRARLHATVDERLADMDAAGIDQQVLSVVLPVPQMLPAETAVPLAAKVNGELHGMITAHPDRFAAFALLPVTVPDAAAHPRCGRRSRTAPSMTCSACAEPPPARAGGRRDRLAGRLVVGGFPTATAALPRAVARLLTDHPGLQVQPVEASTPAQLRALRRGRLEVVILATGEGLPAYDLDGLRVSELRIGRGADLNRAALGCGLIPSVAGILIGRARLHVS
jgi:LysR substrate binding domain